MLQSQSLALGSKAVVHSVHSQTCLTFISQTLIILIHLRLFSSKCENGNQNSLKVLIKYANTPKWFDAHESLKTIAFRKTVTRNHSHVWRSLNSSIYYRSVVHQPGNTLESPGRCKNNQCSGPVPHQLHLNLWGWAPGTCIFQKPPGDAKVQTGLRTTAISTNCLFI